MATAHMSVNATKAAAHMGTSPTASTSTTDDTSARRISCSVALENNRLNGLGTWDSVNISTMPKGHTTPALNLLQWPLIRDLVSQPLDPQCHILAAAYLFYLVRPLEAWNMLTIASTKLQLVLGVPDRVPTSQRELLVRLYWDTLLAESDLLAELELPHSGIVNFEDLVGLPGPFSDVEGEYTSKDELWYFLAEIALRRLLNRVSHLLYVKTPTTVPTSKLARVTAELDFQLSQWYEGLPQPIKFSMTTLSSGSPGQLYQVPI
ncbi:unnamed protein product [Aureobasidium vineae]|uniref:Uncharacterized protein n=1 Tax=Aureobasidium vineae TaxID=2773715 RepID=A0A9N8J960_9PEZI|nr:unnamed protein product [Aureobasidium vineae]